MLSKLLQDRIQIKKDIAQAVKAEAISKYDEEYWDRFELKQKVANYFLCFSLSIGSPLFQ